MKFTKSLTLGDVYSFELCLISNSFIYIKNNGRYQTGDSIFSVYSIKNNVGLTLEYSINVDGVLQKGALFVSDSIAVVDHNNKIYHVKEINGEFSNDYIIDGSVNFSQDVSSVQSQRVNFDDEFLYFFYGYDSDNKDNRTLSIDKYRLDNQALVQQSTLNTSRGFGEIYIANISKGKFALMR